MKIVASIISFVLLLACCSYDCWAQKRPLATLVEKQSLHTFQYDDNDRQIGTQSYTWNAAQNRWSLVAMTEENVNEYDLPQTTASIQYNTDGTIESGTQTEYSYNEDGDKTQELTFRWNADTEQWDNLAKRISSYSDKKYDGKSVMLSDATYEWNDSTRQWVMKTNEIFTIDDSTGIVLNSREWDRCNPQNKLVATTETKMITTPDSEVIVTYSLDDVKSNKSLTDTVTNMEKTPVSKQETIVEREANRTTTVTYECSSVSKDPQGEPLIIWTPNKKIITPLEKPAAKYDRLTTPATETVYEWQDDTWRLTQSSSTTIEDNVSTSITYFFSTEVTNGTKDVTTLDTDNRRVENVVSYVLLDYASDTWEEEEKTEYKYDETTGRKSLEVTYSKDSDNQWVEETRTETAYDSDGDIEYTIKDNTLKVEYIYSQQILDIVMATGATSEFLDPTMEGAPKSAKTLNNGRMVIIRGDKMYDLNGVEIE